MNRVAIVAMLFALGCEGVFTNPKGSPSDARTDATDVLGDAPDEELPLPSGVTRLASGVFRGLTDRAVGGKLFAIEYATPVDNTPLRIVSIDTTTGAVEPRQALGSKYGAFDLQATDTALFWLTLTGQGRALVKKLHTDDAEKVPPTVVVDPTITNLPAGFFVEAYVLDPVSERIYLMLGSGIEHYELGSIPIDSVASSRQYVPHSDGMILGANAVWFDSTVNRVMAVHGNRIYAGGRALLPGLPDYAFIQVFDVDNELWSSQTMQSANSSVTRGFNTDATNAYWFVQRTVGPNRTTLNACNGMKSGAVASVPFHTYSFAALGNAWYVTSLGPDVTELRTIPVAEPTEPPPDSSTTIVSIPTCAGMAASECTATASLIATDDTSLYFTATTAIYKYTPP